MDTICERLDSLVQWIGYAGAPPLPYVGPGGGGFFNPPAAHIELCFILQGNVDEVRIGDHKVRIPCQHVCVHNVHFGNYSARRQDTASLCAFLDIAGEPSLAGLGREAWCQVLPVSRPERVIQAFKVLAERCMLVGAPQPEYLSQLYAYHPERDRQAPRAAAVLVQAALLELLGTVMDEAGHAGLGDAPHDNAVVHRALEYMARRYADPSLDLQAIAAAAHLSVDHFGRVFRTVTGTSPMQRLRVLRIEQARRLLNRSGMRVREIARSVGFEDPYHFSRVFHQVTGTSPRASRQPRKTQY